METNKAIFDKTGFNLEQIKQYLEFIIVFGFVLLYGLSAYQRNLVWKDDVTLWSDVVKKSPEKARAHNNLGVGFNKKGLPNEAISALKSALCLKPDYMDAYVNLGNSYIKMGLIDKAISA
ncbi:MAG: tetratricopeptide repeat protein, partial [Nitrospirota bacterium]|nr:tetratricopeptide repeat protein [Nitrospirota bacterium]